MDNVTIISLVTIGSGIIGLCFKMVLASKCEHFNLCWGVLDVTRNVEIEEHIDELRLRNLTPTNRQNSINIV